MAHEQSLDRIHHAVWDPPWLRDSYPRCLWDGRRRDDESEYCSDTCREMYAQWDHDTSRRDYGREPIPGRHDELVEMLPIRTPRLRRRNKR